MPANPVSWLVSAGRFQAIDHLRRQRRQRAWDEVEEQIESRAAAEPPQEEDLTDDRLRLLFTCCHPILPTDAALALVLREVCGLTTEAIAHAFLMPVPTVAQRIVRAKNRIRAARVPFDVPDRAELPARLQAVLRAVYLVFNEGYSASSGSDLMRTDLAEEAIRLARLLHNLLPMPEVAGLLALVLLQQSRRAARVDAHGDLVPLEEQDRRLWDRASIDEGCALVTAALATGRFGPYCLQAAIAAVHAEAVDAATTDWAQIVGLYDVLLRCEPSPVVELNRAVAIAMRDGPAAGLPLVQALVAGETLAHYHLAHAACADLCRRLGRNAEARLAYARAADLVQQEPERRFLLRRIAQLPAGSP